MTASEGTVPAILQIPAHLVTILELVKARITIVVTLSVATGHLVFVGHFSTGLILPSAGIFLLACGSAALNQVQEAAIDRRMKRTASRPIPSGRISTDWALFVAVLFCGAGFYTLSCIEAHTITILVLGAGALIWYNGVYTYLKRITAYAVVPGALVGAIPPAVGWASGGGIVFDAAIVELSFFFFLWQIPHFWLLLLLHSKDYEAADLPTLSRRLSEIQIKRITCMWIIAVAAAGLLMAISNDMEFPWIVAILIGSAWLGLDAIGFVWRRKHLDLCFPTFMRVNAYAFLLMVCLAGDAVS